MKKSQIILIGLIVIVSLILSIFSIVKILKDEPDKELIQQELEELEVEQGQEQGIEQGEIPIDDAGQDGSSIPSGLVQATEGVTREYISNFDFEGAEQYSTNVLSDYNSEQSEEYQDSKNVFIESTWMAQLPVLESHEQYDLMRGLVKDLKDPENHLMGALYIDRNERVYLFSSPDSLNPVFHNGVVVTDKKTISKEDEKYGEISNYFLTEDLEVTQIDIVLNGYPLKAFMVAMDDKMHLYSIDKVNDSFVPFKTINEWNEASEEFNEVDEVEIEMIEEDGLDNE